MVVAINTGLKGDGKTTLSTLFAHNAYKAGRPVYSNYGLQFPYTELTLNRIKEDIHQLRDAMLLVDEAYLYVDSRNPMSAGNKAISYFVLQSRKEGIDLVLNLLQKDLGDLRIRENADYLYDCEAMKVVDHRLVRCSIEDIENMRVEWISVYRADVRMRKLRRFVFNPAPYFGMFNTRELVDITA